MVVRTFLQGVLPLFAKDAALPLTILVIVGGNVPVLTVRLSVSLGAVGASALVTVTRETISTPLWLPPKPNGAAVADDAVEP